MYMASILFGWASKAQLMMRFHVYSKPIQFLVCATNTLQARYGTFRGKVRVSMSTEVISKIHKKI